MISSHHHHDEGSRHSRPDEQPGRRAGGHAHGPTNYNRAFAVGVTLNVVYILIEAGFGLALNSLALLADAGHNLSDVLGLLLAWGAHYLTRLKPTDRRTYGWRSSTILAALFNALILLVALGGIVWEAVHRFLEPAEITGTTMMWVAAVGVVVNAATALLFLGGRGRDLNIRGAFLHMAADTGVSVGVVAAGLIIWYTQWNWVDPVTSLLIAVVIFFGTWSLLRESMDLALQAVPEGIDTAAVRSLLETLPGVARVHDLHIWAMSTTETALTAHLVVPDAANHDPLLASASSQLRDRFGIAHATLQIERDAEAARCHQSGPDTV